MSSFYTNQANITQAASILQVLGQKALTLDQINARLTTPTTEAFLAQGAKNGWLMAQPDQLWQYNPLMNVANNQNRLISSYVPKLISGMSSNELPASYLGGAGVVWSKAVALSTCCASYPYTLYGDNIKPGVPVVNPEFIVAPNPKVI